MRYLTGKWQYYIIRPHKFALYLLKDIIAFIQRGKRGWADCDLWNLDEYLMSWLPSALRNLAENHSGHPCGLTNKKWTSILNKMADGFGGVGESEKLYFNGKINIKDCMENEKLEAKHLQKSLELFSKYFTSLWD